MKVPRSISGRLLSISVFLGVIAYSEIAGAQSPCSSGRDATTPPVPRVPVIKPTVIVVPKEPSVLTVKFRDDLAVRALGGRPVSKFGPVLGALETVIARHRLRFEPLIRLDESKIAGLEARARDRSGTAQPDLAGILAVQSDGESVEAAARDLLALHEVEWVEFLRERPPPPCTDLAPATPNYFGQGTQPYHAPDPGIDAAYVWSLGARGQGITIADCEYGYIHGTEDLCGILDEPGQTPAPNIEALGYDNHGTATLGEIGGVDNVYGIKGLAPQAALRFHTEWSVEEGFRRVTAIASAAASVDAGDIVMLEMQDSIVSNFYGPAELNLAVWTVTRVATDAGVIVVGAAGNGNQPLDSGTYAEYRSRGDSKAILVGAGSPDVFHSRLGFSTYGSRVNVQGWGTSVFTLGYGSYAELGGDRHQRYTASFNGTSSATPFVAASAAALQSLAEQSLGCRLGPLEMRQLLMDTGTQQQQAGEHIGPLPNLRAAAETLLSLGTCDYGPVCGDGVRDLGELCDGGDTGACPGTCRPDCACSDPTPGEVHALRVQAVSQSLGDLTLVRDSACAASQNSLVYGPLSAVRTYGYTGRICGLPNSGPVGGLLGGSDSYFFLVVANDGGTEGSYGTDSHGVERPEDTLAPTCALTRQFADRCD